MQTKTLLKDFNRYCKDHPDERFWQALRNWSEQKFIVACDELPASIEHNEGLFQDTFYWEDKKNE